MVFRDFFPEFHAHLLSDVPLSGGTFLGTVGTALAVLAWSSGEVAGGAIVANAAVFDRMPSHDVQELTDGLYIVASAPAGWYDIDDAIRRWFDGRCWTDHYAPILNLEPDLKPVSRGPNHGFHVIMVIMTLGAWAPVWLTVGACRIVQLRTGSHKVTVHE